MLSKMAVHAGVGLILRARSYNSVETPSVLCIDIIEPLCHAYSIYDIKHTIHVCLIIQCRVLEHRV